MNRKIIIVLVLLLSFAMLGGCSKEKTGNLQQIKQIEVYNAEDNKLIKTIDDEETLIQFNRNTAFEEELENVDEDTDKQAEIRKELEDYEPQYIIISYKKPAALNNDGTLEKISEITVYRDTNMIMEQISSDTVKSLSIPSESLTFYYEISDERRDFLISLAK